MTDLRKAAQQALEAHRMLRNWIKAVPQEVVLPAMPGIDGDWLDEVERNLRAELDQQQAEPVQEPVLWTNPNLDAVSTDKKLAEKNGLYIPLSIHPSFESATCSPFIQVPTVKAPKRKPLPVEQINKLPAAKEGRWPIGLANRVMRLIRQVEAEHDIKEQT